jgi:hypothetical protein
VLGLRLFERTRGRLQPTVQGLRLFEEKDFDMAQIDGWHAVSLRLGCKHIIFA